MGKANAAAVARWRLRNPDQVVASAEKRRRDGRFAIAYRKHKYGITNEEYLGLFNQQTGRCAICRVPLLLDGPRKEKPNVDHDHASGKVRGLLCTSCNQGLGHFKDNTDHLASAMEYLRKTS